MQSTRTRKRQRLTTGEREAMQNEALDRAEHGRTCGNDLLIITAFAARGIDASPRVDCFTFNAWKALRRHVRKGEHGVHVPVYVTVADQDKNDPDKIHVHKVPTGAVVFHVSQTDPDGDKPTIDPPFTAQERDTLDNITATQRQDLEADDRDEAEDAHEAAILEAEQRDEAANQATLF
jgi:hypothetical protein